MQKRINKILMVIAGAVLLGISVYGKNFWWTSFVGLVPLFYTLIYNSLNNEKPLKSNVFYCGLFGLIFYAMGLYWVCSFAWFAYIGVVILETLFLMAFGATCSLFVWKTEKEHVRFFALVVGWGLLWTFWDWMRGLGIFGFEWYSLFHLQAYNKLLIQVISYTGPYFIDFLIVTFNLCLVYCIVKKLPQGFFKVGVFEEFYSFLGIFIFIILHICAINFVNSPINVSHKVAILQGSLDMWNKTEEETFEVYSDLMDKVKEKVDLFIMPETAFAFLSKNDYYFKKLSERAEALETPFIVGANTPSKGEGDYNSAILISKFGVWMKKQDKMRLVPYGEYVPKILPFKTDEMREFDAVPGEEIEILSLAGTDVKIACAICYDSSFPEFFCEASKKANVFAVISNDWWFGKGLAPENHFMMSVLRAVENRRFVLRSGSNGISGVITPYGEVLGCTKLDEVTSYVGDFGLTEEVTLFSKFGKFYPWIFVLLLVGFLKYRYEIG